MEHFGRRQLLLTVGGLLAGSAAAARLVTRKATVMVVPSMHKRLATSSLFTYDDLYAAVANFRPDFVGVEIRQEDLVRPAEYLSRNYPAEMIALAQHYRDRVFGFDWLGDELAGRPIPDDWWKAESPIKRLERASEGAKYPDDALHRRLSSELETLANQQDRILTSATVVSLADGRYDRVTEKYYATLRRLTAGTPYAALPKYYGRRDDKIASNVVAAVAARQGSRIAVVTGGDHHGPLVTALMAHRSTIDIAVVQSA